VGELDERREDRVSVEIGWELPYRSQRQPALGEDVVAASQPLATQAGMAMFERGGNAVDAAIAAAAALTVVEPTGNGIGGDAFAIVAESGRLHGLNASGRAPADIDIERLSALEAMPVLGWDPVTVPGAISAWVALRDRFGRLDLADILGPAIRCARDGFAVSPLTAAAWRRAEEVYAGRDDFAAAFLPGGRAPRAGERFALPDQAETLAEIAKTDGRSFYEGRLAERIAAHAAAGGGALTVEDLAAHAPTWDPPLALDYGEVTVHELPPNGQGVAALLALGILARADSHEPGSGDSVHLEVEAMKLAFAELARHVGDPGFMRLTAAEMLADARLSELASRIDATRALDGPAVSGGGGTVNLVAADRDGMMVSYIQSNYMGFGSGVVVPGTGIALHNRGAGFVTDPDHPNGVAPGKRPLHTIIPGFLSSGGVPVMAFGLMGGAMQPQGHLQLVRRVVDEGENPQAAVDAPRWRLAGGAGTGSGARATGPWTVHLEEGVDAQVGEALRSRGHRIVVERWGDPGFGGAQLALALPSGTYLAASDPRKDGHAAAR
jgi:gamma-glutamyltranspeptidase / glutathione hydrolase